MVTNEPQHLRAAFAQMLQVNPPWLKLVDFLHPEWGILNGHEVLFFENRQYYVCWVDVTPPKHPFWIGITHLYPDERILTPLSYGRYAPCLKGAMLLLSAHRVAKTIEVLKKQRNPPIFQQ